MSNIDAVDLTSLRGVVIQQRAQKGEAAVSIAASVAGVPNPYEVKNFYSILALPDDVTVAKSNKDAENLWTPTFEEIQNLPVLFVLKEHSDACSRGCYACLGARGVRPLDLVFYDADNRNNNNTQALPLKINKPCKCGGCVCCPFEMTLWDTTARGDDDGEAAQQKVVGQVRENFTPYCNKCYQCCCCCSSYHRVYMATPEQQRAAPAASKMDRTTGVDNIEQTPSYELKFHLCCCPGQSESNNCCGATCCNHNMIFDIRDPTNGDAVVGNVQKLYAPSTDTAMAGCGRCVGGFGTYAIQFPDGSTQEERLMLVSSVMQAEFAIFESQ